MIHGVELLAYGCGLFLIAKIASGAKDANFDALYGYAGAAFLAIVIGGFMALVSLVTP